MEGKPSLTIERNPLLHNEISFYRRKSLTIEGHALQITTNNSWECLAIGRNPLLMNNSSKQIPHYIRNPLTI